MINRDKQNSGVETAQLQHASDEDRRAVMARLGKMATLTGSGLVTLLMTNRPSAASPPPDPQPGF